MSNPAETLIASETQLIAHRSFVLFWCARVFSVAAYMALTVGIGWQIYDLTGSAFDLGLVGLAQFLPFVAAAAADRPGRRPLRPAHRAARLPDRSTPARR